MFIATVRSLRVPRKVWVHIFLPMGGLVAGLILFGAVPEAAALWAFVVPISLAVLCVPLMRATRVESSQVSVTGTQLELRLGQEIRRARLEDGVQYGTWTGFSGVVLVGPPHAPVVVGCPWPNALTGSQLPVLAAPDCVMSSADFNAFLAAVNGRFPPPMRRPSVQALTVTARKPNRVALNLILVAGAIAIASGVLQSTLGLPKDVASLGVLIVVGPTIPLWVWLGWPRRGALTLNADRLSLVVGGREIAGANALAMRPLRTFRTAQRGFATYNMLELTFPDGRMWSFGAKAKRLPAQGSYSFEGVDWRVSEEDLQLLYRAFEV